MATRRLVQAAALSALCAALAAQAQVQEQRTSAAGQQAQQQNPPTNQRDTSVNTRDEKPLPNQGGMVGATGAQGNNASGQDAAQMPPPATSNTTVGSSGTTSTTATSASLSKADEKIIKDIAMANMAEVELGKAAQGKASSDQVKTFAQQMVDDHGKALSEVQALAQQKGVTLPTELDAKHQKELDKLNAKSGTAFDKAYVARAGMTDHKQVHSQLARYEHSAKDPDLKALAAKLLPTVEQHMNSARQLNTGTSGKSTPAGQTPDQSGKQ